MLPLSLWVSILGCVFSPYCCKNNKLSKASYPWDGNNIHVYDPRHRSLSCTYEVIDAKNYIHDGIGILSRNYYNLTRLNNMLLLKWWIWRTTNVFYPPGPPETNPGLLLWLWCSAVFYYFQYFLIVFVWQNSDLKELFNSNQRIFM